MASSTAVRTAEETRVKDPSFLPTKVVATDSHSLNVTPYQVLQHHHVRLQQDKKCKLSDDITSKSVL